MIKGIAEIVIYLFEEILVISTTWAINDVSSDIPLNITNVMV